MKNFKKVIFTLTFVMFGLTCVKAQDSKNVKEKTVKSSSVSDSKSTLKAQSNIEVPLEARRLKTKHDTAKNSVGNIR